MTNLTQRPYQAGLVQNSTHFSAQTRSVSHAHGVWQCRIDLQGKGSLPKRFASGPGKTPISAGLGWSAARNLGRVAKMTIKLSVS